MHLRQLQPSAAGMRCLTLSDSRSSYGTQYRISLPTALHLAAPDWSICQYDTASDVNQLL